MAGSGISREVVPQHQPLARNSAAKIARSCRVGRVVNTATWKPAGPRWRVFCSLTAQCTSWIADSTGDMGRKRKMAEMWLGTRSKRASLPATRRERMLLLTCCDNQRRIPPQPRLAQEARKLEGRPPGMQIGSSAAPHCLQCEG